MMKAKTVKEVLIATKYILENVGWCQGSFYLDKNGNCMGTCLYPYQYADLRACCLDGALQLVDTDARTRNQTYQTLRSFIPGIITYNDFEGRTKQHVIEMLEATIAMVGATTRSKT
jgi:hypothetical protein